MIINNVPVRIENPRIFPVKSVNILDNKSVALHSSKYADNSVGDVNMISYLAFHRSRKTFSHCCIITCRRPSSDIYIVFYAQTWRNFLLSISSLRILISFCLALFWSFKANFDVCSGVHGLPHPQVHQGLPPGRLLGRADPRDLVRLQQQPLPLVQGRGG